MLYAQDIKTPLIPGWLQVIPLAVLVTFALFVFMERLIATADVKIDEDVGPLIKPVTWETPTTIETLPERPEKVEAPLDPPEVLTAVDTIDTKTTISIPGGKLQLDSGVGRGFSFDSRMPLAKIMTTPTYPSRALSRGLEGYVDVQFDISEIGVTENITVIRAAPEGVFEKAAVAAVKKWRFQPSVSEGKAERFIGMSKRVVFEMKK